MMPIHMWWLNAGVAPIYRDYQLSLQLHSASRSVVLPIPADLTRWLPGDAVVDESLYIPADLPAGVYTVEVGILDRQSGSPVIELGIEGKQQDGWYPMGSVTVTTP